jgi:pilus assembly protein CpaF
MTETLYLQIRRSGRKDHVFRLEPGIYPVGSDPDNRIVLPAGTVAWRHAVLSVLSDGVTLEDLPPAVTLLNRTAVRGRLRVAVGSVVTIGEFDLTVMDRKPEVDVPVPVRPDPAAPVPGDLPERARKRREEEGLRRSVRRQIHEALLARLDIKRLAAGHIDEADLKRRARETIRQIVADVRDRLPTGLDPDRLAQEVCDEAVGLGPLEDLLADPEITEIMVNGPDHVYVEKAGKLHLTEKSFLDDDSVRAIIERIVAPVGRRIDESQPYVDARLHDGSRVNAIIHPLSLIGPCLTIRKFSREPFTAADLTRFGTWPEAWVVFLRACVIARKNIVISGGTGSGKTTLLNVIGSFLPPDERILTIEDAAELRLNQPHVIRLEARPPNLEGKGAVTVRDLVRNALRMRPDRIVVGEVRGGEALDMLQAMNTGHEGSLTTVHANTPRDALSRLETMVLMAGMDLPLRAIREQIGAALHLIVHEARFGDGTRKVTRISEIVGMEGDQITMQDLFLYEQTGVDPAGKVLGRFRATGSPPTFMESLRVRGVLLPPNLFDPAGGDSL